MIQYDGLWLYSCKYFTLPKTKQQKHLKMDGWKLEDEFPLETLLFRCELLLVSGRVRGSYAQTDPSWGRLRRVFSSGPTYVFRPPLMASMAREKGVWQGMTSKKHGKNVEKQDFPTMHGKVHMKYQYSEQLFINIITVNYIYIIIGIVYLYQYTSTMTVTICTIFNMLVLFRRRISPHHHWESSSRQNFVWRLLVKASKRGARAPGVWRTGKPGAMLWRLKERFLVI